MTDFEINGLAYRAAPLDAFKQFHCARRLAPAFAKMFGQLADGSVTSTEVAARQRDTDMIVALGDALGSLSDADTDYVLNVCLGVVTRQQANGGGWARIRAQNGALMFDDIDLAVMLQIVVNVLGANLSGFISALPAIWPGRTGALA